jgi:hypothetical protein
VCIPPSLETSVELKVLIDVGGVYGALDPEIDADAMHGLHESYIAHLGQDLVVQRLGVVGGFGELLGSLFVHDCLGSATLGKSSN